MEIHIPFLGLKNGDTYDHTCACNLPPCLPPPGGREAGTPPPPAQPGGIFIRVPPYEYWKINFWQKILSQIPKILSNTKKNFIKNTKVSTFYSILPYKTGKYYQIGDTYIGGHATTVGTFWKLV